MTCVACGYGPLVPGSRYCSNCGSPISSAPSINVDSGPRVDFERDFPRADIPGPKPRMSLWQRLNAEFDAIGLWLDDGIRRIIRKPPSAVTSRVLFIVSAVIVSGFLLISYLLWSSVQPVMVVGVVSTFGPHTVFLLAATVLSIYLVFMPSNWMKALQVLMWLCLARGVFILLSNLLVIAQDWPYLIVETNFLLVLLNYVVLVPFIGFMNVAPATYVWIRTRREALQA